MADKLLRIRELEEFLGLGKHSSLLYKMTRLSQSPCTCLKEPPRGGLLRLSIISKRNGRRSLCDLFKPVSEGTKIGAVVAHCHLGRRMPQLAGEFHRG